MFLKLSAVKNLPPSKLIDTFENTIKTTKNKREVFKKALKKL